MIYGLNIHLKQYLFQYVDSHGHVTLISLGHAPPITALIDAMGVLMGSKTVKHTKSAWVRQTSSRSRFVSILLCVLSQPLSSNE